MSKIKTQRLYSTDADGGRKMTIGCKSKSAYYVLGPLLSSLSAVLSCIIPFRVRIYWKRHCSRVGYLNTTAPNGWMEEGKGDVKVVDVEKRKYNNDAMKVRFRSFLQNAADCSPSILFHLDHHLVSRRPILLLLDHQARQTVREDRCNSHRSSS